MKERNCKLSISFLKKVMTKLDVVMQHWYMLLSCTNAYSKTKNANKERPAADGDERLM